jgi:putative FmdB family regulatory protein
MPIHEYRCTKCSHRFDFFQRSTRAGARAPKECPKCGAKKPTKLLSSFGVNAGASPAPRANGGGSCCSGGGCGCRS